MFYAYCHETKEILAVTMGKRSARQLRYLVLKIKHLGIEVGHYCTDLLRGLFGSAAEGKALGGQGAH